MNVNSSGDERIAKMLSAFFIILLIMEFLSGHRMLMALLTDEGTVFDSSMLYYFLPLLYLLLTAVLLWMRKAAGWFLGSAFLTWSTAAAVLGITVAYAYRDIPSYKMVGSYFPSMTQYVLTFLFFAGMLSGFCTKRVRRIFDIPAKQAATLIIVLSVLSGIALKYITMLS